MIIDDIDISDLGDNAIEAFITFEERLRQALTEAQQKDERNNRDQDGSYVGTYAPQRYYVSSMLAFLDEYDLDIQVSDITELHVDQFIAQFNNFFNQINRARTRLKLRKIKHDHGHVGTPILIGQTFKDDIHKNLETVRKIVNQNIQDPNKRDAIFKKIAALQSEIDRDRTTYDAFLNKFFDLSKTLGSSAEELEPAVQKLERVMAAVRDGSEQVPLLPQKERPKLLPPATLKPDELEDEIPF